MRMICINMDAEIDRLMADTVIPIVDEQVHVTKHAVPTDRVRVRTTVDTHDRLIEDTLRYEALHVERRAVERQVDAAPPPREEGDTTIISLVEERLVVNRLLFVVEEVVIRRSATSEHVEVPVTLRSTRAVVDRVNPHDEQETI